MMLRKLTLVLFACITSLIETTNALEPGLQRYLVSLHRDASDVQSRPKWIRDLQQGVSHLRFGSKIEKEYHIGDWVGYCVMLDEDSRKLIEDDPSVNAIEPAMSMRMASFIEQTPAPWNLARLSHLGGTGSSSYIFDETAGNGTWAYVLDSGVNIHNSEFEGRAIRGFDWNPTDPISEYDPHGTKVAGIIASKTYGVAKKASIVDVRIGWNKRNLRVSDGCKVVEGLEWAVNNITSTPGRLAKSVINASFGGRLNSATNHAFGAASDVGVLIVVAAGNEDQSVALLSPASEPSMITVGAVDEYNWRWSDPFSSPPSGSNYGPGIDIFAPGVHIPTVGIREGSKVAVTGTSAAAPHVAGLALYLKAKEDLNTAKKTTAKIFELARKGVVKDAHGSPNRLAYLGDESGFIWPHY